MADDASNADQRYGISEILVSYYHKVCCVSRLSLSLSRPVAKNFQVGVLSLRVLGPSESEARKVEGDLGSWGGGLPLRTS